MVNVLDRHTSVRIVTKLPNLDSFKRLRGQTDWGVPDDAIIESALSASLFGVIAVGPPGTIGMIRIVGDGAINLYLQDVIVAEEFRGFGLGRRLVQTAIQWMQDTLPPTATVGLMAAEGQSPFYEAFGFTARPGPGFGPGMQTTLSDLTV